MSTTNNTSSEWDISTDIYKIRETIDEIKAKYIEDEDETTLALGIFGFLGDTEAKKIQTSTIMAGELGNEMFPTRAKLDKNILAHAIYCNIGQINAIPAEMTIRIGIKETDLDKYMVDNEFIFDKNCAIYIGSTEFHLDYDIILKRREARSASGYEYTGANVDVTTTTIDTTGVSNTEEDAYRTRFIYSAQYDMDITNKLSNITNPYLTQPIVTNFNNYKYVFMSAVIRQVHIETIIDTMVTNSVIDNKSFSFNFTNQLAGFDVYCTDSYGVETRLTPLFYGSSVEADAGQYCWYLYMNDQTIRISFDPNSYSPGINSQIRIVVYTTIGASGNFEYKDKSEYDIYVDFASTYTSNKIITCLIQAATDAERGTDRKSSDTLKALIPKMAMSRGYITTETDLNNYFNLISTDTNKVKLQRKVDNQLARIWYAYYVIKDQEDNVIPTNTIRLKFDPYADWVVIVKDTTMNAARMIVPCGTNFVYDPKKGYAEYIAEEDVPVPYSDAYYDESNELFYYKTIYNIVINPDPLYAAYYLTVIDQTNYFLYDYANEDAYFGFSTLKNHFQRTLLTDHYKYRFTFTMIQSIDEDYGLFVNDEETGLPIPEATKVKCILVICRDHVAYRYKECEIQSYDPGTFSSDWLCELETDDAFDTENRIKITDMYEVGVNSTNIGYFPNNCEAYLYIAAKLDEQYPDPNLLLDAIEPGLVESGYSLINIYKISNGLSFFDNYTGVINTRVVINMSPDEKSYLYDIFGVPVLGYHYFTSEDKVSYFIGELDERKEYIDYCANLVENNMDVDFKFYNTYGKSLTYHEGDKEETGIGRIDIEMKLRVKLSANSDITVKDEIVEYIKSSIEDMSTEQGDIHFPNLIHDIKERYNEAIEYIEFMNYNNNRLGVQHIELRDVEDPHTVPEFLNIRNYLANDGETLIPCIDIEVIFNEENA